MSEAQSVLVVDDDPQIRKLVWVNLAELARNLEAVLTHDELLTRVWGPEYRDSSHYLHVYLGRIRTKMGAGLSPLLETVPGVGYVLHACP